MAEKKRGRGRPRKVREDGDDEQTPSRGPVPPRISLGVDEKLRKKIRIAAALANMEVGEWCKVVVAKAAANAMDKLGLD